MGVSRADNSVKNCRNLPISNSKTDPLRWGDIMTRLHVGSLVKIPYLLKLSSGNENMGVFQAGNSVKI